MSIVLFLSFLKYHFNKSVYFFYCTTPQHTNNHYHTFCACYFHAFHLYARVKCCCALSPMLPGKHDANGHIAWSKINPKSLTVRTPGAWLTIMRTKHSCGWARVAVPGGWVWVHEKNCQPSRKPAHSNINRGLMTEGSPVSGCISAVKKARQCVSSSVFCPVCIQLDGGCNCTKQKTPNESICLYECLLYYNVTR